MPTTSAASTVREFDILVVGEVNPDIVVSDPDPRPVFGQVERLVQEIRLTIGSSSAIMACGAARLGLRVAIVGVVGDDVFGRFMVDSLRDRGVDVSAVRVDPFTPTGASVILSSGSDRAMLTARGTIGAVTADDVPAALLARARHLHIGSWFLQAGLFPGALELLAAARDAGLTTSIDPNWDPDERWESGVRDVLPSVDLLFPNEAEVTAIAGIDDVEAAAVAIARLGAAGRGGGPLVVVKRGGDGAFLVSADGVIERVTAYPVDPVDTTGAGDAFDAGFLAGWLEGRSNADALRLAAISGAMSTRGAGGTDAQATRAEVEAAWAAWTP
jgi:sugar/nucleoside kinase (ribokinase family)